jgi:hypothetical protein
MVVRLRANSGLTESSSAARGHRPGAPQRERRHNSQVPLDAPRDSAVASSEWLPGPPLHFLRFLLKSSKCSSHQAFGILACSCVSCSLFFRIFRRPVFGKMPRYLIALLEIAFAQKKTVEFPRIPPRSCPPRRVLGTVWMETTDVGHLVN